MADKQDPQHILSSIASGFNKALGGESEAEASDACPHCGKSASEPVSSNSGTPSIGKQINYPGM